MMSLHRETISKDKQCFIVDRFGWDRRSLQLLFVGDADKYW